MLSIKTVILEPHDGHLKSLRPAWRDARGAGRASGFVAVYRKYASLAGLRAPCIWPSFGPRNPKGVNSFREIDVNFYEKT